MPTASATDIWPPIAMGWRKSTGPSSAGSADRMDGITPDEVRRFPETLAQMGKKIQDKIYDDAGRAFEKPDNKRWLSRSGCSRCPEAHPRISGSHAQEIAPAQCFSEKRAAQPVRPICFLDAV
jgi:hypothetical protein